MFEANEKSVMKDTSLVWPKGRLTLARKSMTYFKSWVPHDLWVVRYFLACSGFL